MTDTVSLLPATLPADERLLTLPQVQALVPKSTATIYRWMRQGQFPTNYRIGPNSMVWRQSEISQFIAQHTATPA